MIAAMEHPNIVRIHDVFEENGTAYYVMEYLEGDTLESLVSNKGPLNETEAKKYIHQVGAALSYIHSRKSLHFDVKPSNILLNKDGRAILIDFGVSKHYDESGGQTSSTPVGISRGYAPLEQYQQSEIATFTPATDIYALGATLFRLVTGITPPSASEVNEDGVPYIEGVSSCIVKAIESAMQPRRKNRPQSVDAFLSILDVTDEEGTMILDESVIPVEVSEETGSNYEKNNNGKKNWIFGIIGAALTIIVALFIITRGKESDVIKDNILVEGYSVFIAEFENVSSTHEFKIEKNFNDRWSYSGVPEWCKAKGTEGKIIISVSRNTSNLERMGTIVFKKAGSNEEIGKLIIKQKGTILKKRTSDVVQTGKKDSNKAESIKTEFNNAYEVIEKEKEKEDIETNYAERTVYACGFSDGKYSAPVTIHFINDAKQTDDYKLNQQDTFNIEIISSYPTILLYGENMISKFAVKDYLVEQGIERRNIQIRENIGVNSLPAGTLPSRLALAFRANGEIHLSSSQRLDLKTFYNHCDLNKKITIYGCVDDRRTGNASDNLRKAALCAEAVKNALLRLGANESRLDCITEGGQIFESQTCSVVVVVAN